MKYLLIMLGISLVACHPRSSPPVRSDAGRQVAPVDAGAMPVDAGIACTAALDCAEAGPCVGGPQCVAGQCAPDFVPVGSPCDDGDGGTACDGLGHCLQCLTAMDCPAPGITCQAAACAEGSCTSGPVAAGTACGGDGGVCEADGTCVPCVLDSDCPQGQCGNTTCVQNACQFAPSAAGDFCNSGICNGDGGCVQCLTAGDCNTSTCAAAECVNNACVPIPAAAGTVCGNQFVCDGDGGCSLQPCRDGTQDYGESDVDCGGTLCGNWGLTCADGQKCASNIDCDSMSCDAGFCAAPVCGDGIVSVALGEQCDHGATNGTPGDGCSASCILTAGRYINDQTGVDQPQVNSLDGLAGAIGELNWVGKTDSYSFDLTACSSIVTFSLDDGFGGCPPSVAQAAQIEVSSSNTSVATVDAGCPSVTSSPGCTSFFISVSAPSARVVPFYVLEAKVAPSP